MSGENTYLPKKATCYRTFVENHFVASGRKHLLRNCLLRELPKAIYPKVHMETYNWLRENEGIGKIRWMKQWAIRMLIIYFRKGRKR
jgi:hypothetical protein